MKEHIASDAAISTIVSLYLGFLRRSSASAAQWDILLKSEDDSEESDWDL